MKIATIIPYFNGQRTIERAILSAQSDKYDVDVIVVNDGSDDQSSEFLRALGDQVAFYLIESPNAGQGSARNIGIKQSKADLICFLDQDDYFLPNHYGTLLDLFESDPDIAFAYGDLWRVSVDGIKLANSCIFDNAKHPKDSLSDMLGEDMHILPSASMVRREALIEVGGFDPQFRGYEDDDLFIRMFLAGYRSAFTAEPVTAWTLDWNSTSFSPHYKLSRLRFLVKYLELLPMKLDKERYTFEILKNRFWPSLMADLLRADNVASVPTSSKFAAELMLGFGKRYKRLPRSTWVAMRIQNFLALRIPSNWIVILAGMLGRLAPNLVKFIRRDLASKKLEKNYEELVSDLKNASEKFPT